MEILALVGILYFLIGASICLLICVNPNDPGVLGKFRAFFFQTLPTLFNKIIRKLFGERALGCLGSIKYYLAQTNHPIVQWFYYLIAVGGFFGYAWKGIFKHMPNSTISQPFVVVAYVLAGLCFWVYYKACSTSPGQVTKQSSPQFVKKYKEYYDGIMYKKDNKCTTCTWVKPPRSKHCSICKMCVSKYDHHCVWIRQCVGQRNYKYFVVFLFLHSIWCSYLSIIGSFSLYESLLRLKFWESSFRIGTTVVKGNNLLALQYLFVSETLFFFLIIMCAIMGITLAIFVTYHFFLIAADQTTNERVKKSDYVQYLKKQLKDMKKYEQKNPQLPKVFEYKGDKITKKEYYQIKDDMGERLGVLQNKMKNHGFFYNLKVVLNEKDS